MDGGFENPANFLHKEFIRPDNIVSLFEKYNVPIEFDLLSVDTDMHDYFILQSILNGKYKPKVIITEVNSKLAPGKCKVVPWPKNAAGEEMPSIWDGSDYFGASVSAFHYLAGQHGYTMVYCEIRGINCFFVADDILGDPNLKHLLSPGLLQRIPSYSTACGHNIDAKRREYIDVCVPKSNQLWVDTQNCMRGK